MSFSETKENPVCVFLVQVTDLLFLNSEREVGGRKNEQLMQHSVMSRVGWRR